MNNRTKNICNKENLIGQAFEELSFEEMAMSQGSGEIQPRTTTPCAIISAASSLLVSVIWC